MKAATSEVAAFVPSVEERIGIAYRALLLVRAAVEYAAQEDEICDTRPTLNAASELAQQGLEELGILRNLSGDVLNKPAPDNGELEDRA